MLKNQQWRCLYCEHEVKGMVKPSICPFCGFSEEYMVDPATFFSIKDKLGELTEQDIEDLRVTVELEKLNVNFYRDAEDSFENDAFLAYIRQIRRNEEYHLEMVADYLEIDIEEENVVDEELQLPDTPYDVFEKGKEIEAEAVSFYSQARARTDNRFLEWVYDGLITSEDEHIDTFDLLLESDNLYLLGE